MFDETSPHHNGLETLSVNCPELDVSQSYRHTKKDRQKRLKATTSPEYILALYVSSNDRYVTCPICVSYVAVMLKINVSNF